MTDTCNCPPDDCHGGHTIDVGPAATLLSRTQAWMLAHDWTETSEGPAGWQWEHTTGRKVGVPRNISDDRDLRDGLLYRLAQTHQLSSADIEREIRGDEPPVPHLTDEHLRRIAQYVHPDEATDYVRPWLHSMAAELLALRKQLAAVHEQARRATDNPDRWTALRAVTGGESVDVAEMVDMVLAQRDESRARVVELEAEHGLADRVTAALDRIDADRALEAAQRAPVGYAVVTNYLDARWVQAAPVVSLEAAQARARVYAEHEARVVELREVTE